MGPEDRAPPFIGLGGSRLGWTPWSSMRRKTATSDTVCRLPSGFDTDDESTSLTGTFFSPEKSTSSMPQLFSEPHIEPALERHTLDDTNKETLSAKKATREKARRKSTTAPQLVPEVITGENAHLLLHKPFFLKMVDDGSWLYVEDERYYHQIVESNPR